MELELAKKLVYVLEESGFDAKLHKDYSGRCMYGRSTAGVSTEVPIFQLMSYVIMWAEEFVNIPTGESLFEDIDDIRADSLGLGMIYY